VFTKREFGGTHYLMHNFRGLKKLLDEAFAFICVTAVISRKRGLLEAYANRH